MRQRPHALWLALTVLACSGERSDEIGDDAGPSGSIDAGSDDAGPGPTADAGNEEVDSGLPGLDGGNTDDGGTGSAVSGRVLSFDGIPLSDVTLVLDGQTVQTDADGRYEASVTVPYDIALTLGTDTYAYLDVTRLDPTLRIGSNLASKSATVQGVVSGAVNFPLVTGNYVDTTFVGGLGLFSGRLNPGTTSGDYGPLEVVWEIGDELPGYLVAVLSSNVGTGFSEPIAVGFKSVVLTNGSALAASTDTEVSLAAANLRTVTLDATLPDGYTMDRASHYLGTYSRTVLAPVLPYDMNVVEGLPSGLRQSLYLEFRATDGNLVRTNLTVGPANSIDLDVPVGARPVAPAEGANEGPDGTVTFTAQASGISVINFEWEEGDPDIDGVTSYRVQVALDDTSLALSRLQALGIELAPSLLWRVTGTGPWTDIDAYLAPDAVTTGPTYESFAAGRTLTLSP